MIRIGTRHPAWVLLQMITACCLAAVTVASGAANAQEITPDVQLRVLVHPLDVRRDDILTLVVGLQGEVSERAVLVARVYEPVATRPALRAALAGDAGTTQDRITLPLADIPRTASGHLLLGIPTTSGPLQRGLLRLPSAGVFPLRLEVREQNPGRSEGPVLGDVMTVLHAVTDPSASADLDVSYVAQVTAPPTRQPDGTSQVDDRSRDALTDLIDTMERTEAPFSMALPPEFVDAMTQGDTEERALWERLLDALGQREVMAAPAVTLDASTAVRSGLSESYTTLLRRGEDIMSVLVGRDRVQRSVQVVNDSLDVAGAVLMRDLGTRSVVLTPRAQDQIEGVDQIRDVVDTTHMVAMTLGPDSDVPAALVDPDLAERLNRTSDLPAMDALDVVAELLVIRYGVLDRLGLEPDAPDARIALARRSVTLTSPHGQPVEPALMAQVLERIGRTAGLRAITASEAGASTGLAIANGLTVQLPLPDLAGTDLSARAEDLFVLSLDSYTVASMLPDGDPRPASWSDQVWRLTARDLSAEQVEVGLDMVRDRLNEVRRAVSVPSVNDITLGGRRSTIRLKLRNDAAYDVLVAVRLESAKLSFPGGQELVAVPGGTTTEVEIPVEVRSNGRFPVSVTLLTPEGDVPLGEPIEFAARATALTGLGQVASVAGGLILASWWLRHVRMRRRSRRSEGDAS